MKAANSSGELIGTSSPDSSSHFLIAGSSDACFIAAFSFLTIGSGVPGGANNALHATASKPFEAVSSKVGTSGRTRERLMLVIAMARIALSLINGTAVDAAMIPSGIWSPAKSVRSGPVDL